MRLELPRGGSLDDNLANSLLFRMIEPGRTHPLAANTPVPDEIELGLARENQCPLPEKFDEFGLRRTNPDIWANFQWFVDYMHQTRPLEAGVYDLSRYQKVADMISDKNG